LYSSSAALPAAPIAAVLFEHINTAHGRAADLQWPGTFASVEDFHHTQDRRHLWAPVILVDDADGIANDNVQSLTALVFDFDHVTLDALGAVLSVFAPYEYAAHSSWRHTAAEPRFRLVLPLSRPASQSEHAHLWKTFADIAIGAGAHPDPKCRDAAHRYYWPVVHPDRLVDAFALHNPGKRVRVEEVVPSTNTTRTTVPNTATRTAAPSSIFSSKADAQRRAKNDLAQDKDVALVEASCAFLAAARDLAAEQIKEPEWHAALSLWLRCEDGDALAHARSAPDPRYNREETQRKIDRIKGLAADSGIGPATCSFIRSLASPENRCANACGGCKVGAPLGPIKSPVVLGLRADVATQRATAAKERVADLDDAIANASTPAERSSLRAERSEANAEAKEADRAASRAAVLAPAAAMGSRIFARGDHTELAFALVGDLETQSGGCSPVHHAGRLYSHDTTTGTWREIPEHALQQQVTTYAGSPVAGPKPAPLRINRGDQTGVAAMVEAAIRTVSPNPLPMTEGAAFQDGILLPSGIFRAFVPGDYVLANHALPVHYLDPSTQAPPPTPVRWLRFLQEIYAGERDVPERIAVLQEFLGAALFGVATRYQKSLALLGETGANGKSVLLRVAGSLFPGEVVGAIAPHHLEGSSSEYYRAMLLRLRLNVVSELPENELMDTSTLKAVIAGDEVIAREIRESPFRGRPRAAWVIAANTLPPVRDTSGGFWRRQLVLTHNVRFDGKDGRPAADPNLAEYLLRHELPGIAAWAAEGGKRLLAQNGYTHLASSDELVDNWARDNDPVRRFCEEHLVADANGATSAKLIYKAYQQWSAENGNSAMASARLFRRLPSMGMRSKHTKGGNVYACRIVGLVGFAVPRSPAPVAEA